MNKQIAKIYQQYFSPDHLRLAWERWIRTSSEKGIRIKDDFGREIFEANLTKNLERLSDVILAGEFQPRRPFKYYEPKPSRTQRTQSILSLDDALVYQSIANVVATNNYGKLVETSSFVFGSVLHPEVEQGLTLLKNPKAEYFFFQYFVPLYNKFVDSSNKEIMDSDVKFRLETDITGFFDSIPHSKLLLALHKFGVQPEILELLQDCLNIYSGTRDSSTPGVGIPVGSEASRFFANALLYDLDCLISQKGYTYYRYMDDIRVYDETEEKISEAVVLIDNHLKGQALSLNSKKTSIEEIPKNRAEELLPLLAGYEIGDSLEQEDRNSYDDNVDLYLVEQEFRGETTGFRYEEISDKELIKFCKNEISETEKLLFEKFSGFDKKKADKKHITDNDALKKDIVHLAFRWRRANSILREKATPVLHKKTALLWLFCLEHFFWRANSFCWNLNQYGANEEIKEAMMRLLPKFQEYEWVRYHILSSLSHSQSFTKAELRKAFRDAKEEPSPLARVGYYTILLEHTNQKDQLRSSVSQAIKNDVEPYIREKMYAIVSYSSSISANEKIDVLKEWFEI